ncbi:MAG TPA: beta-ketoacyl-ACP synthase III [Thermoanaerobaculia bacterium]|nr:beta-ketoacyl-ACP synthase III [Thermoanaerobaculia bacterium]
MTAPNSDTSVGLLGIGAYLPARIMENEEWAQYVDTTDAWIVERTGIHRRRVAAEHETTVDLAVSAAQVALARAGVAAADLAEIIVATDTPEVVNPDTAAFVQHRLGAGEIPAYDLGGSGCAGFVQALDVARARVLVGRDPVLVIGVELLTRRLDWRDRNTAVLFGDGAGAAVVTRGPGVRRILGATAGTDGSQAGILGIEVGGSRRPFSLEEAQRGSHKTLVMNGKEVFREAVRRMSAASRQVLEQTGVALSEVDLVVPHQANLRILQAVAHNLDVPWEKVFCNVQEYGNIGSASIPVALWEAENAGRIAPGATVLLTSFGAGFHWAAMLLRWP